MRTRLSIGSGRFIAVVSLATYARTHSLASTTNRGMPFLLDDSGALEASGDTVSVAQKATQSTKFNALWQQGDGISPTNPGPHYFEVKILEGEGTWAGFTDQAHFGSGWKCKSLSYGGNLSDGGGLKRGHFGPNLKPGSTLGMRAEYVAVGDGTHRLDVHLSVDGQGLGKAFEIQGDAPAEVGPLYPVISFSTGPARAAIATFQAPPAASLDVADQGPRTSVAGQWAVPSADLGVAAPPDLPQVIFSVDLERGALGAKVANMMSTGISQTPPHAATGGVRATMMMPPPAFQEMEKRVGDILGSVSGLELAEGGATLALKHAGGEVRLQAYQERHAPVMRGEIGWWK